MTYIINKLKNKITTKRFISAEISEVKDFLYRIHEMLFEWRSQIDREYIAQANDTRIAFLSIIYKKADRICSRAQRAGVQETDWLSENDLFPLEQDYRSFLWNTLNKGFGSFINGFKALLAQLVKMGFLELRVDGSTPIPVEQYKLNYEAIGKTLVSKQDLADAIECDGKSYEGFYDWASAIKAKEIRYELDQGCVESID